MYHPAGFRIVKVEYSKIECLEDLYYNLTFLRDTLRVTHLMLRTALSFHIIFVLRSIRRRSSV